MEEEVLARIDKKLDAIVRLLASRAIEGKNKTEAIIALGSLGLEPTLIAEIVDTTVATVYARLSEVKRKKSQADKKASEEGAESR